MRRAVNFALIASLCLCVPSIRAQTQPAVAADLIIDGRLRFERVDQDGLTDANALTLRLRVGYEQPIATHLKVLGELESVGHISDDFADTIRTRPGQSVVLDPEALEINRLQAQWANGGLIATFGRQRLILNNARHVGNVGFRQNEQTFDALRLAYRVNDRLNVGYAYIDEVLRILGDDSPNGRWRSDSHIAHLEARTRVGEFSTYVLLLDFDNAAAQSGQTLGVRWNRSIPMGPNRLTLEAEAARQSDYGNSPAAYSLGYLAASATIQRGAWRLGLGAERLEGNGRRGFATPLATLHAFQGWADVFLATPPDGVRDLNLTISHAVGKPRFGRALNLTARLHHFASDDGAADFGNELDLLANWRVDQRWVLEAKSAFFDGDSPRFADRSKFWLAVEYSY